MDEALWLCEYADNGVNYNNGLPLMQNHPMNKCSITKARISGLTMIYLCLYTDPLFWEDLLFN